MKFFCAELNLPFIPNINNICLPLCEEPCQIDLESFQSTQKRTEKKNRKNTYYKSSHCVLSLHRG